MYYITTKRNVEPAALLGKSAFRGEARSLAKELGGTVRTEEEFEALSIPAAKTTMVSLATEIAKAPKAKLTIGTKEKFLKRVFTSAAVLKEASAMLKAPAADESKVDTVRRLARWTATDGTKLQRRDALALLAVSHPTIAPATVSTQWQLVRSGKLDAK